MDSLSILATAASTRYGTIIPRTDGDEMQRLAELAMMENKLKLQRQTDQTIELFLARPQYLEMAQTIIRDLVRVNLNTGIAHVSVNPPQQLMLFFASRGWVHDYRTQTMKISDELLHFTPVFSDPDLDLQLRALNRSVEVSYAQQMNMVLDQMNRRHLRSTKVMVLKVPEFKLKIYRTYFPRYSFRIDGHYLVIQK